MKNLFIGCENAASATAKIEVMDTSSGKTVMKVFFGNAEDVLDWQTDYDRQKAKCYYYLREILNWGTGRMGNWQICKSNWG